MLSWRCLGVRADAVVVKRVKARRAAMDLVLDFANTVRYDVAQAPGLRRRDSSRRLLVIDTNSQASVETSLDAARTSACATMHEWIFRTVYLVGCIFFGGKLLKVVLL